MAVLNALLGGLAAAGLASAMPVQEATQAHSSGRIVSRAPAIALPEHIVPLTRNIKSPAGTRVPRPFMSDQVRHALALADVSTAARPDYGLVEMETVTRRLLKAPAPGDDGGAGQVVYVGAATAASNDIEYIATVQAGNNSLSLIVDTGSSDTWFVKSGFQCLDRRFRQPADVSECQFGPAFAGDFPGGQITDQHFNVTYGSLDGPFLNGLMGFSE